MFLREEWPGPHPDVFCTLDRRVWRHEGAEDTLMLVSHRDAEGVDWMVVDSESGRVLGAARVAWHYARGPYRRVYLMLQRDLLKKALAPKDNTVLEAELVDEGFQAKFPTLAAFMLVNVMADGEERERSSVRVFAEGGCWKACLNDGHAAASIFVTLKAPADVFQALEKALSAEKPDWRRWRDSGKRNGGRR